MKISRTLLLLIAAALLPLAAVAEDNLAAQLAGRILLQVERHGEAWYVHPVDGRRYFLGRPADALHVMSSLGLGISDDDLDDIPMDDSAATGDRRLRERLAGRILLQVEDHGAAWYVDPLSLRRVALGRPADAFRLLQSRGLGASDASLARIPEGRTGTLPSSHLEVPFIPQAPTGEWWDARQHEGCEEASVIMALAWARGESFIDAANARATILAMADWQQREFGYYHDTSISDTADRLLLDFSRFTDADVRHEISAYDIIDELADGNLVITAINGRTVGNVFFEPPGPLRHMVVVTGYDAASDSFLVHDPGTRRGAEYRYSRAVLERSLRDYPSGRYVPIPDDTGTAMIVVHRK